MPLNVGRLAAMQWCLAVSLHHNVNLVRMKRNVFKCNKPRGPYHKFGYYPDDGSKQYNRTLYDSLLLSFGGA